MTNVQQSIPDNMVLRSQILILGTVPEILMLFVKKTLNFLGASTLRIYNQASEIVLHRIEISEHYNENFIIAYWL